MWRKRSKWFQFVPWMLCDINLIWMLLPTITLGSNKFLKEHSYFLIPAFFTRFFFQFFFTLLKNRKVLKILWKRWKNASSEIVSTHCELNATHWWSTFTISFAAGFEFFESANGVILCPGDEHGLLPSRLFAKVVHKKGPKHKGRSSTEI